MTAATSVCAPPVIVVPAKPFAAAKRRLAPALDERERASLARAMLEDVLAAAADPRLGAHLLVVTADEEVAQVASRYGARVLHELVPVGMTEAVRRAATFVPMPPGATLVVLPGDVPLVTADDLEHLIGARTGQRDVVLVPAARDGGTNAVACHAAAGMRFCFGPDSFARHVEAARALGLVPRRLELDRLALDVDTSDDVQALLAMPASTRSHACLQASRAVVPAPAPRTPIPRGAAHRAERLRARSQP